MLAREAFREMLFPLSEKELHYREHPEDSLIYFKNFRYEGEATVVTGADNSDEILFFSSPKKQAASNLHGVISPKIAPRVLEGGIWPLTSRPVLAWCRCTATTTLK